MFYAQYVKSTAALFSMTVFVFRIIERTFATNFRIYVYSSNHMMYEVHYFYKRYSRFLKTFSIKFFIYSYMDIVIVF